MTFPYRLFFNVNTQMFFYANTLEMHSGRHYSRYGRKRYQCCSWSQALASFMNDPSIAFNQKNIFEIKLM